MKAGGRLARCMDEQVEGVLVSDELRRMLLSEARPASPESAAGRRGGAGAAAP